MIEVIHFQRKPEARGFSIERLFADLRASIPPDIVCRRQEAAHRSRGFWPRVASVLAVRRQVGSVNHVTGDVHFLVLGLPRSNTILTIHDCGILRRSRGWKYRLLRFFWYDWPIAHSRIVTVISEATKTELLELTKAAPGKIRVIHNCVSPEFVPMPAVFHAARPLILLLGTAPNKNLQRMAEALEGLACTVELVGDPSEEQRAVFARRQLAFTALGNISQAGIVAAYARCDLVLFASLHEGFGLPILEAQAMGRPVITSDCSSMPEVADDTACLVNPYDPASIRAGVERVIRDAPYRSELLRRGYENARRFSAQKIAAQYAALYREIAGVGAAT